MINIYKASAGSGKTFTLAREYIKLILGRKDENGAYKLNRNPFDSHRSVLAITFTNKATEEMKSRIIHELAVIAGYEKGWEEKSPYEDELCQTFNCSALELKDVAGRALRDLLYDFNFFSVSTIDSFFQLILRAFAHEAEVSGNYELELEDKAVIGMGVDQLLQDLNHGKQTKESKYLINWLSNYMTQLIEDGKSFNLFNRSSQVHKELILFIGDITDDTFKDNEARIIEYLSDLSRFNKFKDDMAELSRNIKLSTIKACTDAVDAIVNTGLDQGLVNSTVFTAIKNWMGNGYYRGSSSQAALSATVLKACENIDSAYTKKGQTSPLRTQSVDGLIAEALGAMQHSCKEIKFINIITANLYQLGLLSTLISYIDKYRQENSTILLSDTNNLLSKIIGNDDTPFIYERVGVWFKHFLIDEFQDTSLSQWRNLRPLISESLSYDHDNLVIGDEKQCIYRFRNSDPTLLHNLHSEECVEGHAVISGDNIKENTNWRSSSDVIRFNNTIFSALTQAIGFNEIYQNVAQQISPKHCTHHGYVTIRAYSGDNLEAKNQQALDNLTAELRRQLSSGYRPGDIAILVRRWSEGEMIIRHLEAIKEADSTYPEFRIVSDSSLLISRSPAVLLILSRLRLMSSTEFAPRANKKTQREIAVLINDFEAIHSSGANPSQALSKAITNAESPADDIHIPAEHSSGETLTEADLVSVVERIIDEFVPKENLATDNQFITAFQDLVTDFVAKGQGDIRTFLKWWDETGYKSSIAGARDDYSLNILTIHKSKGLEFPCVHIPFADMNTGTHSETAWFELPPIAGISPDTIPPMVPLKISSAMIDTVFEERYVDIRRQNLLDAINLLYVAFTRAVDELHIGILQPSEKTTRKETGTTLPNTLSELIYSAAMDCTPDFCKELERTHPISNPTVSPFTQMAFNSDGVLSIGSPTVKHIEEKGAKKTAMSPAAPQFMPAYRTTNTSAPWDNTRLDTIHDIEVARDRGIILHDLMAKICTPADIPNAINQLRVSPDAKSLTTADIQEIRHLITQRVSDKRVARWFDGYKRLLIERPIAIGMSETRRPDRIVWTADGEIHIIDYKSGEQPPQRYKKQVKEYVDILTGLGYENVTGYLYYLDTGTIVKV